MKTTTYLFCLAVLCLFTIGSTNAQEFIFKHQTGTTGFLKIESVGPATSDILVSVDNATNVDQTSFNQSYSSSFKLTEILPLIKNDIENITVINHLLDDPNNQLDSIFLYEDKRFLAVSISILVNPDLRMSMYYAFDMNKIPSWQTLAVPILTTSNLAVFPNPAKESVHISFQSETEVPVLLFSTDGRILYESSAVNHLNLNVSEYPAGNYLLKVGNTTQKIVLL